MYGKVGSTYFWEPFPYFTRHFPAFVSSVSPPHSYSVTRAPSSIFESHYPLLAVAAVAFLHSASLTVHFSPQTTGFSSAVSTVADFLRLEGKNIYNINILHQIHLKTPPLHYTCVVHFM